MLERKPSFRHPKTTSKYLPPSPINEFEETSPYGRLSLGKRSSGSYALSVSNRFSGPGRVLEQVLRKLSVDVLPGGEHAELFLRDAYRRNCRANTLHAYSQAIRLFLACMRKANKGYLEEITREDIGVFIEHEQDRGMKPSTVRTRLVAIYAFLRFLVEREAVHPDVIARKMKVKLPELLPRAIDADEVRQLLAVIEDTRDRAMILLLLRTGMRIGELLSTRVNDINLREQKIMIYEAEKTFVGRVVYFSEDARAALEAWLKERDTHKELLFYGQGRERLTYTGARMRFTKYLQKAGLSHKGYTIHCLRHTYATELLNAGLRLECLQQLLGHTNLEITRRYARLTDNTREEEYFRAMSIIERNEKDDRHQLDGELATLLEEEELLGSHR